MKILGRGFIVAIGLIFLWQFIIMLSNLPPYILPDPKLVLRTLMENKTLILDEAAPTIIEAILGLALGIIFGMFSALTLEYIKPIRKWFLPVLLLSQALPTFAIAPLMVVWFGYGMAAKIITAVIMLFFPITNSFYDGLRQTNIDWLDLAKTMNGSKWKILTKIKIPAALPSLASGIRVAAVIAPIGAVIGEWVGASKGLCFLMLNSNARMQIDLMFAALLVLTLFTILLYFAVDFLLKKIIWWQKTVNN
jgi:putative hydroxymethylpyrimidine transport system permease protein